MTDTRPRPLTPAQQAGMVLREIRESRGLTIAQAARQKQANWDAWYRYEHGRIHLDLIRWLVQEWNLTDEEIVRLVRAGT